MSGGRVAIDWTPAVRQQAGIGRYTRELVRTLVRRGALEYTLCVMDRLDGPARRRAIDLAGEGLSPGGEPPTVRISGLPARWHTGLWHRLGVPLPVEIWSGPATVFHATDFLAPPTRSARTLVTIHDLSFLRHPERAEPTLARFLAHRVPRSARRAAHILADSECTRGDIVDLLGIPRERVSVAYAGVGEEYRRVHDPVRLGAARRELGLETPFVLGVGTLEPRKDWPTLIRAFADAERVRDGRALVIAGGRGWGTAPIFQAVESARAAGADVRLLGFVPDRLMPALYSLAEVFAFPSVYEGFGLPPLEALACGVPAAVASAASLPEVVGDAALLVPPGDVPAWRDALVRLVEDSALRSRLAARGPLRAARFSWDGCAEAVEAAYATLIPGSRAAATLRAL